MSYTYHIEEESNDLRNYGLSVIAHGLIFVLATVFGGPLELPEPEVIEIEYMGISNVAAPAPKGTQVQIPKPVAKTPEPVIETPPVAEVVEPTEVADISTDIEAPSFEPVALEEPVFDEVIAEPALALDDVDLTAPDISDLETTQMADVEAEMAAAEAELNEQIRNEENRLARQAQEAVELQQQLRAKQAAAAAAAKAKAQAKARAQARVKAIAARKAKQAAAAARRQAIANSRKSGQGQGGAKVAGAATAGAGEKFGTPNGVRELADLKQVPGNPKPIYTAKDRLDKKQGVVVFLAYVTRSGALTNFRMKQSSGHRTLDVKTLQALKRWKFYPGQQGWVELPFKWFLDGKVQEYPSGLRRKLGRNY